MLAPLRQMAETSLPLCMLKPAFHPKEAAGYQELDKNIFENALNQRFLSSLPLTSREAH